MAEDGPIPERYPLCVLPAGGYCARTLANVVDSDGTLIVYFAELEGGTELTLRFCLELGKPFKLIDGAVIPPRQGALASFVEQHGILVLNVAGPRASTTPKAYAYAYKLLASWLQRIP